MTRLFAALGLLLLLDASAFAQATSGPNLSVSSFDPEVQTSPSEMVEGPGIKIGEGTTLHPVIGMQTGVVSNVFYEDANPNAAGVLRLIAQVGAGSLSGLRLVPAEVAPDQPDHKGSFEYRAELRLGYDFLLSGNDAVQGTGGLAIGATLRGMTNPMGKWSFGFNDSFNRLIRAANFETDADTNRDINFLSLNVLYHPQGRSLGVNIYYNNTLDIFERSEQSFANRQMHRIGVRPMWRWLPETTFYADISQGITAALGSGMKNTSYPLAAVAGVATLLTVKTTLGFQAGYVNGFYTAGPSYSSVTVGSQLGYRYSPLGRATLAYDLQYQDSVNANYFRDHVIRFNVTQPFVPFVFMVQPELHLRRYEGVTLVAGPPTRDDLIIAVTAGLHYNFRNSLAATLDYRFSMVSTDYTYMVDGTVDDPGFSRHELLAGVRWAL
jgi:hypothetical protein